MSGGGSTSRSPLRPVWLVLSLVVLLAGEVLLVGGTLTHVGTRLLFDFRGGLFDAGRAVLHGRSPYQPGFLAHQAAVMRAGGIAVGETAARPFSVPVYPALANALVAPLSLLPFWAAGVLFSLAAVAAMIAGMWLLGVTDRRCLLLMLVSWPFTFGVFLGAVGPFLVLGAGVAWRWRERLWAPALAIATLIAVKVFPWTLGVWLLITRRYRAAGVAAVLGIVLTLAAWALIGFQDLAQYPRMLSEVSSLQENRAVSVGGLLVFAGVGTGAANVMVIAAGLAILALARRCASGPDGDRRAFGLAVLAALTATPIVWEHYMVLLFVPIALISPRLSRLWLIPVLPGVITAFSYVVIPGSANVVPFSADTLRTTLPWLAAELTTAVALCTTAQQRSEWAARFSPVRRSSVQAADPA
jgi:hypothetical protein